MVYIENGRSGELGEEGLENRRIGGYDGFEAADCAIRCGQ